LFSNASNYPEKMVEEKIMLEFGTKNSQKIDFFLTKSKTKSPKNLNYTKDKIGPWYIYAQKRIKEKEIILRPVEREQTSVF
jgi:hypothetical protein